MREVGRQCVGVRRNLKMLIRKLLYTLSAVGRTMEFLRACHCTLDAGTTLARVTLCSLRLLWILTWGGTLAVTLRCMAMAAMVQQEYEGDDDSMDDGDRSDSDHEGGEGSMDDGDSRDSEHEGDDDDCDSDGEEVWRSMLARNLRKRLPDDLVGKMMDTYDIDALGDALCSVDELYDKVGPMSSEWKDCLDRLRTNLT